MSTTQKPLTDWTEADFSAWATNALQVQAPLTDQQVAEKIFAIKELKPGSIDEAKRLIQEKDAQTPSAQKETPTSTPSSAQSTEKTPTPPPQKKTPAPKQKAPSMETLKNHSTTAKIVLTDLENYARAMKPGVAHHGNQGPSHQVKLFRIIQTILRQTGNDFNLLYGHLLEFVAQHRDDVFNERYAFRYFDALTLSNRERRNFERILSLIIETAHPKMRASVSERIDLNAVFEGFDDPDMQQRVMSFYNLI